MRLQTTTGSAELELAMNTAFLALPVGITCLCLGLLLTVAKQEFLGGSMSKWVRCFVFWTPRMFGVVFALLVGVFALNVFGAGYDLWETTVALFMHLIPSLLIVAMIAVTWRWELIGGALLLGAAFVIVIQFALGWGNDWTLYTTFVATLVLVAALFFVNYHYHNELQTHVPAS